MDEKGLGARLQGARQAAGYTQQQLCQKSGLSYSTLAKIERGAIKSPSIFTVQQIAAALGTSVDQLLGDSGGTSKKQSKNGVTFVYFDINGCLVRYYQRAFAAIAQETGISSDIVEATYLQYNDAVCKGIMSLEDFNATLARCFEVETFDWAAYYLNAIVNIEETAELIAWVSQHYKVGLLSNIMPGLIHAMMEKGLLPNIAYDAIIDSSEVKLIKPDPAIYQIAAETAGCPVSELLLVDDTKVNVLTAERAGWQALWFDDYSPTDSVKHIRETLAF
jgi:FMN phosphatase YigB (HAD superfamily)/DNA-binding XRE family transcriptional regulator